MNRIGKTLKRRRHEFKTDYLARTALLSSGKPRLVVRRTNRYICAFLVHSEQAQDRVVVSASSAELLTHGWPASLKGSLKSLPAAYLTGLIFAHKAKKHSPEAILDIGMHRNASRGRLYAFVAGALAGGLHIPHSANILPAEARLIAHTRTREAFIKTKEKLVSHG